MTERDEVLAKIFAACWKDDTLKARFLRDPKSVLVEFGIAIPADIEVKVVENTADRIHVTLPAPPATGNADLSDDELGNAAGGALWDCSNGPLYTWNQGAPGCG